jgi:hypothetical protein
VIGKPRIILEVEIPCLFDSWGMFDTWWCDDIITSFVILHKSNEIFSNLDLGKAVLPSFVKWLGDRDGYNAQPSEEDEKS